ncbi:MAG: type II toxin-antitoxin system VapC family toxin [Candidatus Competibacter sp.]|nr:type II toxin-antitoxin system VapC family toxin [Candidatus Competibacter sp.]
MRYVIDASVAIKWMVPESPEERDISQALVLLDALRNGGITLYQPAHWEAEIAAILARISPATAIKKMVALRALAFTRVNDTTVYATACDLAIRLNHHLFDTLYHAVALHAPEATLVTADQRYFDKAQSIGQIVRLGDLPQPRSQ